ncbi:glycosyltransferase [Auraticoccus cholistanensis]|nr:glycosyltransferase [Auraticoccus cholistanensis]
MRALICTFGTRGDIEPFVALAERLVAHGHEAVLAAPEAYRGTVPAPVGFFPVATEMDEVMRAGMADLSGPSQALRMARRMSTAMRLSLQQQWAAARQVDPTIVVAHPKALGGLHVAERLGVPVVASLPLPFLTPTGDFPIPFLARPLPARVNRFSYQLNRFTAVAYGGMINAFRRRTLGLRRISRFSDLLHTTSGERVPVLYPFSPRVVPVPSDYPASAHVTGYWFRQEQQAAWAPPRELVAFLADGEPAIYVGFGSMGFGRDAGRRGRVVMDALARTGVRAVVSTGWGALRAQSSSSVMVIDEAPHSWLFPRVAAVVHHGGSGTTAAGLRAGRPTLVCPVLGDQPFWGRRVQALGAGPTPLRLRDATTSTLAARIRELVSSARLADDARTIGEAIRAEDGTGRAVEVLEGVEARG